MDEGMEGNNPSNEAVSHPVQHQIGNSFKGKILSCSFGIDKNQVTAITSDEPEPAIIFKLSYTSKQPLIASIYYFASEEYDKLHNLTSKVTGRVGQEDGYHYKLEPGQKQPFSFKLKCDKLKEQLALHHSIPKISETKPIIYPVILRLEPMAQGLSDASNRSILYTYLDLTLSSDTKPTANVGIRRQKREVNRESFDLIDVFNAEEGAENLCLICMSEEPDCIIMPCRHMVVNLECAQQIDDKKDDFDCPLCRCRAEELIYVNRPKPSHVSNTLDKQAQQSPAATTEVVVK